MSEALKPCPNPFNRLGPHILRIYQTRPDYPYHVQCSCGLEGPGADNEQAAETLWNRRDTATLPTVEELDEVAQKYVRHDPMTDVWCIPSGEISKMLREIMDLTRRMGGESTSENHVQKGESDGKQ